MNPSSSTASFVNAADFGFSPSASGMQNAKALQRALDRRGTVIVSQPGEYAIADTVYVSGHTSLIFGNNVFLKKVNEQGLFTHVLLNKGALTKTDDENILIEGLNLIVNGIDAREFKVFGLHGHVAFFHVKDLCIRRFRCMDVMASQYGIHICTFEDILIEDVIIKGDKDGIHLGRGKRFTIRNGVFQTYDDAIALNAHDYDIGNPELGWIEDGVIEKCWDLDHPRVIGFFCRILAGAWIDWRSGMQVQKSDTVVSNGRLYRVSAKPDGMKYVSTTAPSHESGSMVLDGIDWRMVQDDVTYTAGVRNVTFRDIHLQKPRIGFSVHFDNDSWSRSYYPDAPVPQQEQLRFDQIRVTHDQPTELISVNTPVDVMTITHGSFRNNWIDFRANGAMADYGPTQVNLVGCVFNHQGEMDLLTNSVNRKTIIFHSSANIALHPDFRGRLVPGPGTILEGSPANIG